jgi:hypothetical protein
MHNNNAADGILLLCYCPLTVELRSIKLLAWGKNYSNKQSVTQYKGAGKASPCYVHHLYK